MLSHKFLKVLLILFLVQVSIQTASAQKFQLPPGITVKDYIQKDIIFRIKPEYRSLCSEEGVAIPELKEKFSLLGVLDVAKKFKGKKQPQTTLNRYGEKMEDLSLIYELHYSKNITIDYAANYLLSSGVLVYAEPHYLPQLLFVPNDPAADTTNAATFKQTALKKIKAYQAWDIQKGDTNIVVGITDTGTDVFHPDLLPNNKINYYDPINGIDDDNDGYTDNYYGWDLGENDSMPQWHTLGHGAFVAGITAGVVNNSIGIAGIGFKSKYMPVKIDDAGGSLVMSYEAIIYAVDHGCSIVNCSWGGYSGAGQFGQNVINYATNNMDAIVVAAAGNSNNDYLIYPASYDYVLSVANVDFNDVKASTSSYGPKVDLSAPGNGVYSTWINGGYTYSTGTSFSAPYVAGAAAIIKAHYPNYSAIQIAQQIKSTTDIIDTIAANAPYIGMLGTGRLNLYKALTESGIPSVTMLSKIVGDNNDNLYSSSDTIRIWGTFKNYLAPTSNNFKVTLSSDCPYVQVLNNSTTLGIIPMLGTANNLGDKFTIKVLAGVPTSYQANFKLKYEDNFLGYTAYEYFSLTLNVDYIDIDTNFVATTITSKGKIGYNQTDYQQGLGFTYMDGPTIMGMGGFVIGNSTSQVSDNLYGPTAGTYDNDFKSQRIVQEVLPPVVGDFEVTGVFNDSLSPTKMSLSVRHNEFAWDSAGVDKFIILEYTFKNNSSVTYSSLYPGLFIDWDMSTDGGLTDRASYDATTKMGYTYASQGGPYAAIKLVSHGIVHHYAFDNDGSYNGTSNSIKLIDGFTGYEKYNALKTNSNRNLAGTYQNGNDVSDMISTGPYILLPGDSVKVAFALIIGDHLADIQASAIAADEVYNHTSSVAETDSEDNILMSEIFPNPLKEEGSVILNLPEASWASLSIYDCTGNRVLLVADKKLPAGKQTINLTLKDLSSGLYLLNLQYKGKSITREINIVR
jgi:serine protease